MIDNTSPLDTNLNQTPYWDDYNRSKQYYRVLFKPSTAVQTRELNVLQDMMYNQVYRFGQNIFVSGTIIKGCNITFNKNLSYVKLIDTYANGSPLNVSTLVGYNLISVNTGLYAKVFYAIPGSIVNTPNLNTVHVQYFNSIANSSTNVSIKAFQNDEILNVLNAANSVVAQIKVANTISSGTSNTTGFGYYLSVDDGVIFQKGMMLEVAQQSICVTAYTNQPNGLSVGFTSPESIVTAYQDTSLFDNSQGASNATAPGADRLKLTPSLAIIGTATANQTSQDFFSIVDFVDGSPSIINQNTDYSVIGQKMAQISDDTNGPFVIKPFNIRTKQLLYANGSVNANNIRVEVDTGTAYIEGSRVDITGQVLTYIPKGLGSLTACSQIITAQYGNFVTVQEFAGLFNTGKLEKVYLCNAAGYAVSNNLSKGISTNSLTAPGTVIGNAYVLAVEPVSVTTLNPNAQYNLFLYGVSMSGANSFNNVMSIYANTGSVMGLADVVLQNNIATLQQSNLATLIFPFNQSAIKTVKTSSNTVDLQFEYTTSASVTFANSGSVTINIPSFLGGNNVLPYGTGQLNSTQIIDNILLIAESTVYTPNLSGSVTAVSACTLLTGTSTSFTTTLVPGTMITVSNSTSSETKLVNTIANNTSLNTVVPFSYSWTSANISISYIAGEPIPLAPIAANVYFSNATSMTITLPNSLTSSLNATILYNILRKAASPAKKDYQTLTYAVINTSSHVANVVGPYSLGVPDVISISNVWIGNTASNTNPSIVNNFTLITGQSDVAYQLASIQSNKTLAANSILLVEFQCFQPDFSTGIGYYSVDSYPVDDTGLTANSIYTYEIPSYFSVTGQEMFHLRNCLDFRFYATNTIPYVSNITLAMSNTQIINPSNTLTFPTSNNYIVDPQSYIQASLQYYLGRYDKIGLSNTGTIIINSGVPAENPIPPMDVSAGITLATVYVPPYPSLTNDYNVIGFPYVSLNYNTNRRYTMADIGSLDARISQLEYYTALSVLEQSAQNMQINNSSGATVFQNGILVDPFANFSIANCSDPNFNIAIDVQNNICRPIFTQFPVNLVYQNATSTDIQESVHKRLYTLDYVQLYPPFISQPFGSHERNCAQDTLYIWSGTIQLTPDGAWQPDVTTSPTITVATSDLANWQFLANAWGTQWGAWEETGSQTSNSSTTNVTRSGGSTVSTTTDTQSTTTTSTSIGTQITVSPTTTTSSFGDVVTSLGLQPFIPQTVVLFYGYGLKPNSQHWAFFNDINVTQYCCGTNSSYAFSNITSQQPLITDANGNVWGVFIIPANTFNSSTINFQLLDIANLTTQSDIITSQASASFFGTNIAYTQNQLDLQTTSAQLSLNYVSNTVTNTSNISTSNTLVLATQNVYITNTIYKTNTIYITNNVYITNTVYITNVIYQNVYTTNTNSGYVGGGGAGTGTDPIAQSFTILPSTLPSGTQAILATSIDVFFANTDTTMGITFQIQPVSNGTIQNEIVPFSQYHLLPSQINTSTDSSAVTNIYFEEPIQLMVGQQYAFILQPDGNNPNYDVWCASISDKDILTGAPIFSLSSTGIMFMSSGSATWTPYQNESIKFNLYIAGMTAATGTGTYTNKNDEYLSYNNNPVGIFSPLEQVYVSNTILGNTSVISGNNIVYTNTAITLPWSSTLANQVISIVSTVNQKCFISRVVAINNSTALSLANAIPFNDNNATITVTYPVTGIVGIVNSTFMIMSNSTSNTSTYLSSNVGFIFGSNSGAYINNATLVDMPYNSVMPKLSISTPSGTTLNFDFLGVSNSTTGYISDANHNNLHYGKTTQLLDYERVIMSQSNEMQYKSGAKSYTMFAYFSTINGYETPIIDDIKLAAWTVHNVINGDNSSNGIWYSEINNAGNAIDRYISTTVTLAPGIEAEDVSLYVGAYYPSNTGIYAYIKILNQYDPDNFNLKSWTPLFCNNTYRSSLTNLLDYNDYIFTLPTVNTAPYTAELLPSNNYIASYTSPSGGVYSTYTTFAVKLVLTSNNSAIVPRLTNYRCVSSQSTLA